MRYLVWMGDLSFGWKKSKRKTLRHFESNAAAFLKKAVAFSKFVAANFIFAAAYLNSAVNFPKTSRLENRCHTCQRWVNVFITNNFLWKEMPFFLVIACHASIWQAMTSVFSLTCHRNPLYIKQFGVRWQVWQRFFSFYGFNSFQLSSYDYHKMIIQVRICVFTLFYLR